MCVCVCFVFLYMKTFLFNETVHEHYILNFYGFFVKNMKNMI